MVGSGLRFLVLDAGYYTETATCVGGLAVGAISALMVRSSRIPIAVIAYAGAVAMIPGLSLYRSLAGALQLARQPYSADPSLVAATLGHALQASIVIAALVLGLILGSRTLEFLFGKNSADLVRPTTTS
jgi:uncharacterized membrane protein YjjB (DUF3815 family)